MPKAHLPDLLYGGLETVANQLDELGSDATMLELSCGIVNVARSVTSNIRTIDKVAERVASLDKHIKSLVDISAQQAKVNASATSVVNAIETALRHTINDALARIESLEREVKRLG